MGEEDAGRHSRVHTIREDEEGDVCRSELLVPSCLGQVDTETIVNSFGKTLFGPESNKAEGNSYDGSGDDEEEVGCQTQCSTFSTLIPRDRNSKAFQRARCSLIPGNPKKAFSVDLKIKVAYYANFVPENFQDLCLYIVSIPLISFMHSFA